MVRNWNKDKKKEKRKKKRVFVRSAIKKKEMALNTKYIACQFYFECRKKKTHPPKIIYSTGIFSLLNHIFFFKSIYKWIVQIQVMWPGIITSLLNIFRDSYLWYFLSSFRTWHIATRGISPDTPIQTTRSLISSTN